MFKNWFKREKTEEKKDVVKSLEYGEELKLVMNDGERRVVTVIKARADFMRVKELFHGIYDMKYDEIMYVCTEDGIYTANQLKKRGEAHAKKLCA